MSSTNRVRIFYMRLPLACLTHIQCLANGAWFRPRSRQETCGARRKRSCWSSWTTWMKWTVSAPCGQSYRRSCLQAFQDVSKRWWYPVKRLLARVCMLHFPWSTHPLHFVLPLKWHTIVFIYVFIIVFFFFNKSCQILHTAPFFSFLNVFKRQLANMKTPWIGNCVQLLSSLSNPYWS